MQSKFEKEILQFMLIFILCICGNTDTATTAGARGTAAMCHILNISTL